MEEKLSFLLVDGAKSRRGEATSSATIESIYIDTFLAQTCFVVKRDSDLTHILIEAGENSDKTVGRIARSV